MEPLGKPSMKVILGSMEPFNRSLAAQFVNHDDSHSVYIHPSSTFSSRVRYAKHYHTSD